MSVRRGTGRSQLDLDVLSRQANASNALELIQALALRVQTLESQTRQLTEQQINGNSILNLLLNSDFAFSTLNYTGAGSGSELYKWVQGCDSGVPITNATNPGWEDVNGNIFTDEVDDTKDISQQFDRREILPGVNYYLSFLAKKGGTGATATTGLRVGLWDLTQDDWITASVNGPGGAAPTVEPSPIGGGSTTYKYKIVAITDSGYTIVSAEAEITNSFATLNSGNYNEISWAGFGGVLEYQVYRTFPVVSLIARLPAGNTSYNDIGTNITSPTTVPTNNPPQAVTEVLDFGATITADWQVFRATISVPGGYDVSASSAGDQFFRMQLFGDAPAEMIYFDRIGLSSVPGGWQASPTDANTTDDISITPVGDDGTGSTGIYDPNQYSYSQGYGY